MDSPGNQRFSTCDSLVDLSFRAIMDNFLAYAEMPSFSEPAQVSDGGSNPEEASEIEMDAASGEDRAVKRKAEADPAIQEPEGKIGKTDDGLDLINLDDGSHVHVAESFLDADSSQIISGEVQQNSTFTESDLENSFDPYNFAAYISAFYSTSSPDESQNVVDEPEEHDITSSFSSEATPPTAGTMVSDSSTSTTATANPEIPLDQSWMNLRRSDSDLNTSTSSSSTSISNTSSSSSSSSAPSLPNNGPRIWEDQWEVVQEEVFDEPPPEPAPVPLNGISIVSPHLLDLNIQQREQILRDGTNWHSYFIVIEELKPDFVQREE